VLFVGGIDIEPWNTILGNFSYMMVVVR